VVNSGSDDVLKLELVFPTGGTDRRGLLLSAATHHLLDSGTKSQSAQEIAEAFEFYGSHLQTDSGPDWKSVSLFSLGRFFGESLALLSGVFNNACFPESELGTWKTRSIQSLRVNREKVSWLSKTAYLETLFGAGHPYGFTATEQDYESASAEDIRSYYKGAYPPSDCLPVLSGKVSDEAVMEVMKFFNDLPDSVSSEKHEFPVTVDSPATKTHVEKKDALQCGIRIGKILFSKTHPDYPAMQVVNTILGGYFGSRLMSNIREDKGYTYGIGSGIHPYLHSGVFSISTEVGKEVLEPAIHEIFHELDRLCKEPVPVDELELVKNYLVGAFQRSLDGPFSLADRFKGLRLWNLDYGYLDAYLETVKTCRPESIMELAFKYLRPESMTLVTAG
jgi:predicted Zn-dependent peptidase